MNKSILLVLIFVFSFAQAQSVNDYKYAIVSSKFDFLKSKDQYNLNMLT